MSKKMNKLHIVIVDDNQNNLVLLGDILRDNNYSIGLAKNGVQALKVITKSLPDLILLDYQMPDMNGIEVCKELKKNELTKGIPVIFITANTNLEIETKAFEAGAADFITKPFFAPVILARVKAHLSLKMTNDHLESLVEIRTKELKFALNENSILLKEIHDRVKNNLQLILALIDLQQSMIDHDRTKKALKKCYNRIMSMALVHQHIYRNKTFSFITNLYEICDKIVTSIIIESMKQWHINIDIDNNIIQLNIIQALPCVLIINELVANIVKHAYTDLMAGDIIIKISRESDTYSLVVSDRGKGLPEDFEKKKKDTLGFVLIETLTAQLKGTWSISPDNGTTVTITFPAEIPVIATY